MSFTITTAFVQQFSGNVRFIAQQQESRLRMTCLEDTITGESAFLDQLAPTAAVKRTQRHGDSPILNSLHLRRRVTPYDYEWGDLVDQEDKVRTLIDPESNYARNAGYAMKRGEDDEIINAFFVNAYTGKDGSTVAPWPAGDPQLQPAKPGTVVAVNSWAYGNGAGNAGMTISKVIEAKVALDAAEGDESEPRYMACSAQQVGNMLATTEATSADYNSVKALVNGEINTFLGFNWIRTERLGLDANGFRRCAAYRRSAMGFGVAKDVWSRIQERADKSFSVYVYCAMSVGAARLEECKLAEIKCA
jgi:hypothetical protein